ncbi:MAG: SGNH/GDSL hydrolase family protein [Candidatus Alcyoniella australis]|nr:SGNH/GDSL hydrolase family protein [Candidatus Alcyoniella australis]
MHPIHVIILAVWVVTVALEYLIEPRLLPLRPRRVLLANFVAGLPTLGLVCLLSPEGPHFNLLAPLLLSLFIAGRIFWVLGAAGLFERVAGRRPPLIVKLPAVVAAVGYCVFVGLFWGARAPVVLALCVALWGLMIVLGGIDRRALLRMLVVLGVAGLALELAIVFAAPRFIMRSTMAEWGVQLVLALGLCCMVWFNAGLVRRFNTTMLLSALLFIASFNGIYLTDYAQRMRPARYQVGRTTMYDLYFNLPSIPLADADCAPDCIGFRDRFGVAPEPAQGTTRVIWMGGSAVYGFGLDDEETIAIFTEQMLNSGDRRYEVLNAGIFGYDSANIMAYYARYVRRYNPHYLLIMTGFNDYHFSTGKDGRQNLISAIKALTVPGGGFDVDQPLFAVHTQERELMPDIGFLKLWQRMLWDVSRRDDSPDYSQGVPVPDFESNLDNLLALAAEDGARVLLITEPTKSSLVDQQRYQSYQQAMARVAARRDCPLLDLAAIFREDPFHERLFQYGDKVHPTGEGNRIIARLVVDWIQEHREQPVDR